MGKEREKRINHSLLFFLPFLFFSPCLFSVTPAAKNISRILQGLTKKHTPRTRNRLSLSWPSSKPFFSSFDNFHLLRCWLFILIIIHITTLLFLPFLSLSFLLFLPFSSLSPLSFLEDGSASSVVNASP